MFQLRQSLLLFITATIWGSAFIAQSIGMDHVSPYTFTFFRTFIGALILIPVIIYFFCIIGHKKDKLFAYLKNKNFYLGSLCCGLCLLCGESFQQFGLVTTDAGKAGFITSMYIIFVPILGLLFGKKINCFIFIGIILSVLGLYFLCIKENLNIELGDLYIFICAIAFSVHILVIAHFVEKVDGLLLSCGQFFVASFFACILMFMYGNPNLEGIKLAMPAFLYAGIMSNGIAYTLQIIGQRGLNPTIATLIMSLESVMAAIFGTIFLDEIMSAKEYLGCFLMLMAVIIAQMPSKKAKRT